MTRSKFVKNFLYFIGRLCLHLIALGIIVYFSGTFAKWYFNFRPLWGVDFFLSVSLANLLKDHLVFPYEFWNYGWFSGWPQIANYPLLPIYFIALISRYFDLVSSAQILVITSSALFILGAYFLFYVVSRNYLIALVLAVATVLSNGVYQTLTWAGSLPSYTAQVFFPWVLAFLYLHLKTGKARYLWATVLLGGISIWSHQQIYMIYIVPAVSILTFFSFNTKFNLIRKLKVWIIFVALSLIIGLPQYYSVIGNAIKQVGPTENSSALSTTSPTSEAIEIEQFHEAQVKRIVTDNHLSIFIVLLYSLFLFILSFIAARKLSSLLDLLPILVITFYFIFYIWLFGQGISVYHGGWYRLFWSVPVFVGMLASAFWRQSILSVFSVLKNRYLKIFFYSGATIFITFAGFWFIFLYPAELSIGQLIPRSQVSSAHPDVINLTVSDTDRQLLKSNLTPSWMSGDEANFRLYDADQTVNIWWNSLFKMPLARGYLDPPVKNSDKGFIFALDSGLSEDDGKPQLTTSFNYPPEVAVSNSLFLVDWNAIKYFEGGHMGAVFKPLPGYLEEMLAKRDEILEFNDRRYTTRPVTLHFWEIKDELTSPILSATNASTLGIFASDSGYETVIRAISETGNINSQKLIPVKMGRFLEDYSLATLKNFDALYLYDYDYKKDNNFFQKLSEYVKSGKKIYMETGVEVKNSSGELPELFPVQRVTRKGLGAEWNLETGDFGQNLNVEFKNFSPLVFDDAEWNISYSEPSDLRAGARVLLKNKGKVILASQKLGEGEIIWGGFNQAYHLIRYHNLEEAKFFNSILSSIVDLQQKSPPDFSVNFVNANEREITFEGAKGVLFKEQAYEGWTAKTENGSAKNLKIYKAGPAVPGFMYIFAPEGKNTVVLKFSGSLQNKIFVAISILIVLWLLDEVVLRGLILGRISKKAINVATGLLRNWWQKEDE